MKKIVWLALVFTVIGLGGCATTLKENFSGKSENITVGAKDFTSVGLVFVETVISKGNGEKITYDALMKAAAEKEADAIVNVTIDVKKDGTKFLWFYINPQETWYGSALAIKYTESIDASLSNDKGGIQASGTGGKKFLGVF